MALPAHSGPRPFIQFRNHFSQTVGLLVDIIKRIKINRVRWAGHVIRRENEEITNIIMLVKPEGKRKKGRPRMRWVDGVKKALRNLGVVNWKSKAQERNGWRKFLERTKIHKGLWCQ
jgi:hypothetical protein